tara:strand:- start:470 stop:793 length:324 start_codon:yes stop_codon:yes gene_type:complete
LSQEGYDVRFELPCEYDLTVHGSNGITRLQVKSISDKGIVSLQKRSMRSKGVGIVSRYHLQAFDYLCAVDLESHDVYLVPIIDLKSKSYDKEIIGSITINRLKAYKI